jgi:hypothetical protein
VDMTGEKNICQIQTALCFCQGEIGSLYQETESCGKLHRQHPVCK